MLNKSLETLIMICRQDFCRILDQVLRSEGLSEVQRGDLRMVGGPTIETLAGGAREIFMISAEAEAAERLIHLLRACPLRSGSEKIFELYTFGSSSAAIRLD